MDAKYNDVELMELSERVKPFTWLIRVFYSEGREAFSTHGSGFALTFNKSAMKMKIEDDELLLMTCAHVVKKSEKIEVSRVGDENINFSAKIVDIKPSWDIALLLVKGVTSNCIYGEFADDNSIGHCETLLNIGHLQNLVWSTFVGRAAYPCGNSFVPLNCSLTCGNFDSTCLETTLHQRFMGHILNCDYFEQNSSAEEKYLNPYIPIIQGTSFSSGEACSGGPVVNMQGKIVGMLFGGDDVYTIAIHVTLLKEFMRKSSIMAEDSYDF